jgi:hypothetical protein
MAPAGLAISEAGRRAVLRRAGEPSKAYALGAKPRRPATHRGRV